jgi:sodium-independent sulfate anion transporter 11
LNSSDSRLTSTPNPDATSHYNRLQSHDPESGIEEENQSEDEEDKYRYDGGESMDGDVEDDDDREAKGKCCSEARLNCSRFTSQMRIEGRELRDKWMAVDCRKFLWGYFSMDVLRRRFPFVNWAPKYRMVDFQGDLIAGITVGMTMIPQSIAYAAIAGLPSQYGLYSAFVGCFVYVLLGSTKDSAMGPSAVVSLLSATFATSPVANDATPAIALCFFVGLIYCGMALFSLGFIVDFFSFPVMKAFTVAAAITIAATQVKVWLALEGVPRDFIPQFVQTIKRIPETKLYDFALGFICIAIIILLKKLREMKWKTRFSLLPLKWRIVHKTLWFLGTGRNIIVLVLSLIAAYILMENGLRPFKLTGDIPSGIPAFKMPAFSQYNRKTNVTLDIHDLAKIYGYGLIIVPLIGILEAVSIIGPLSRRFNYRMDVNQELLAHGVSNILTSFFSGYIVCVAFSRSAVQAQSGARTPLCNIWTGIIILISLQWLTPMMYYIPKAALAVVIIMAVIDMITFQKLWIFWKTRKIDLIPWFVTLIASLVLDLAYGVLIGAGFSIALLLYPTSRPKIKKLKHDPATLLNCSHMGLYDTKIILVKLNSGMMYPAVEYFKNKVMPLNQAVDLPKGVILDFQHVSFGDTTTVQGVRILLEEMHKKGVAMVISGMRKPVEDLFVKANPKHFIKAKTVEEAVMLIYGLKKSSGQGISNSCEGIQQTCPWVPRAKQPKNKRVGIKNQSFVDEEISGNGKSSHGSDNPNKSTSSVNSRSSSNVNNSVVGNRGADEQCKGRSP